MTTLVLPAPVLAEGRFASISLYSDQKLFEETGIRIAFTTRHGGVSEGEYDSLNLGSHVNDSLESVQKNREILLDALNASQAKLIVPNQVHGSVSQIVDSFEGAEQVAELAQEGADALILETQNVAALLCYADCVPVIIVLPTGGVSVIHAGWRGVDNTISVLTLEKMIDFECQKLGIASEDVADFKQRVKAGANVYIGAHIHAECFETSSEIRAQFAEKFGDSCTPDERHVDLDKALRTQLCDAGISPERIVALGKCTVCNNQEFFSYRAQNGKAGRHGAFAVKTR